MKKVDKLLFKLSCSLRIVLKNYPYTEEKYCMTVRDCIENTCDIEEQQTEEGSQRSEEMGKLYGQMHKHCKVLIKHVSTYNKLMLYNRT